MADNQTVTNQKATFETDTNADIPVRSTDRSGQQVQHVRLDFGDSSEALLTPGQSTKANSLPVTLASDGDVASETTQLLTVAALGSLLTELQAKADLTETQPVSLTATNYARITEISGTTTYYGEAAIGSATSSAVWRIRKMTETSGPTYTDTWADGNDNFDNVWDNRASLSYS